MVTEYNIKHYSKRIFTNTMTMEERKPTQQQLRQTSYWENQIHTNKTRIEIILNTLLRKVSKNKSWNEAGKSQIIGVIKHTDQWYFRPTLKNRQVKAKLKTNFEIKTFMYTKLH